MHRGVGCTVLPKNSMIKLCKSTLVFTPKLLKKPWPNLYSNFPKFDSVQCNIGGICGVDYNKMAPLLSQEKHRSLFLGGSPYIRG